METKHGVALSNQTETQNRQQDILFSKRPWPVFSVLFSYANVKYCLGIRALESYCPVKYK